MSNNRSSDDVELIQHEIKLAFITKAKDTKNEYYGDVSDLNLNTHDPEQIVAKSLGRGTCAYIARIDNLDPRQYSAERMLDIGAARATKVGNVYTLVK